MSTLATITFGTAADLGNTTGTSHTAGFTVAAGDNAALILTIVVVTNPLNDDDLVSVTYAGLTATRTDAVSKTSGEWLYQYVMLGPPVGTADVVVVCTNTDVIRVGAHLLYGVSPDPAFTFAHTSDTPVTSLTVTGSTLVAGSWTVLSALNLSGDADNLDPTDCTQRVVGSGAIWASYDEGPFATPGATSMSIGGGAVPGYLAGIITGWAPAPVASPGELVFDHLDYTEVAEITSMTFAFTAVGGDGRILVVVIYQLLAAAEYPTVVTFAGVPLTLATTISTVPGYRLTQFTLLDPPAGLANVAVTFSATINIVGVMAVDYLGGNVVVNPNAAVVKVDTTDTIATTTRLPNTGDLIFGAIIHESVLATPLSLTWSPTTPENYVFMEITNNFFVFYTTTPLASGSTVVTATWDTVGVCGTSLVALAPQPVIYFASPLTQIAGVGDGTR